MTSLKISRLVRVDAVSHDYLYYSVMSEAQDVMYDYLVKRDKVSSQDLKKIRQRKAIVREPFKSSKPVATALDNY